MKEKRQFTCACAGIEFLVTDFFISTLRNWLRKV